MAKQLLFDQDARKAIWRGLQKAASAIKSTLGPRGRTVLIDKSWGAPQVTKDGGGVADEIELTDPFENMGAQMLKEAASKTSDQAGDGTTTACVLTEALFGGGYRPVAAGADAMGVSRGIKKGVAAASEAVKKQAQTVDVKDRERLIAIGTIAANGDGAVGEMLASAFAKIGKEGAIAVEEGKGIQTEIKIVEGMQFDRGFLSPHFVTNPESVECVLEEPFILIHEDKLTSVAKLIPLLEKVSKAKKPLLIISEEIEGEALATLVVNKLRGILTCCAVKAPGYGDRRKAMLEDIAILTGGKPLFKDLGIDLEKVTFADLGRAKRVLIDQDNTTILEGAGDEKAMQARCVQIRKEYDESDSDYDREKLQERLSKLSGGVAQIHVGAATETELKERKRRVEDALHAVRAALEDGVVVGGGVALLRAQSALDAIKGDGENEQIGIGVVRRALEAPLRQIAENAGIDPSVAVKKVLAGNATNGFNAETGEYGDLRKAGVLDPTKVVVTALQNASSVAALLLTTEALISEIPEEEKDKAAGAGAPMM